MKPTRCVKCKEVSNLVDQEDSKYSWCSVYTGRIWGTWYSWGLLFCSVFENYSLFRMRKEITND